MGDALYRLLLRVLPADLRRDFGDDMAQMFRDYRQAASGHPLRQSRLWMVAIADVAAQAAAERTPRGFRPSFHFLSRSAMRAFLNDFRHGLRLLGRYRATSWLAIFTLALGIGANAAIFSVVDRVLLRTLPYPEPEQLAMVWEKRPSEGVLDNAVSAADFLDWRRLNGSFAHLAAFTPADVSLTGDGDPLLVTAGVVSPAFFDVLSARPAVGRTFRPDDETLGKHRVVVLSHGLWQRRFGGDASVIDRTVTINGNGWQVVGVLDRDFQFIDPDVELWVPLVLEGTGAPPSRVSHNFQVYGRTKPGVTVAQAREEMDRLGRELEETHPQENRGHGAHVMSMKEHYVGPVRNSLVVLFAAVGFVLLIACVNVASLLVSRALSRGREMAVRSALGASRGRLMAQSLVESVALAMAGGAAGVAVAFVTLRALPVVLPARLSMVGIEDVGLDLRVLLFLILLSVTTGILFGLLPAWHASKPQVAEALKDGGRGMSGGARHRTRSVLVVAEVALAALTLMGAGLAVRSFGTIMAQPLGFDPHGRLAVSLAVTPVRYPTPDARRVAMAELERRLAAVPGVDGVGAIDILPLSGGDSRRGVGIEGREPTPDAPTRMHPRIVTPGYFSAMNIPIVAGRGFIPQDDERASRVVMISEASARRFWPGEDPVGKRVILGGDGDNWRTIVGVAGDVRHWGLVQAVNPVLYAPQAQVVSGGLTFVLETTLDPASLTSAIRQQLAEFDRNIPVGQVQTLNTLVDDSVRSERAQTVLMAAFGVLALTLAVVGIYGVMAQLALARVPEIGLRMALGAVPSQVLRRVLLEGVTQTLIGLVLGLGAGVYLMRFATALLFGIKPWDGLTLTAVTLILILAALVACFVPARRAMRVDPVEALRGQ